MSHNFRLYCCFASLLLLILACTVDESPTLPQETKVSTNTPAPVAQQATALATHDTH